MFYLTYTAQHEWRTACDLDDTEITVCVDDIKTRSKGILPQY